MARAPPEPSTGFADAVSGVKQPQPKGPTEGSAEASVPWPVAAPKGFAKLGWLVMLKNSARNCVVSLSPNFQLFETEKSMLWKPPSRKMLRPEVPKVPNAGGRRKDLPLGLT